MGAEKNLLTTKRYFNASPVDTFLNIELTGEKSFIKPDKTDNVIDLSQKFSEERNACMKFCVYGLIQSKWCDSDAIKIDFNIADSTTNISATTETNVFWVYDKTTNITAHTWSIQSRPLDNKGGSLSQNLYRKKKGSYFFPFEIDLNSMYKNTSGINTNKSIFITINEPNKNAYLKIELPFLYFDEDGNLIDFGQETADILDNGTIVEINNNYPFFYDRHWLRKELIPDGPPYVYFVLQEPIEISEGSNDPRVLNDNFFPVEVTLSEPSKSGAERVNIEILYGLDENQNEYTTVKVPSDVILQQNYIEWNFVGDNPLKYVYIKIVDDFFVEPEERLTLKLTPIFGCVADPEKSELLQVYFRDNDVPSFVSFESSTIDFIEPRENTTAVPIKINMNLDKTVLVDDQYFDLYIDRANTDSNGTIGFIDPINPNNLSDFTRVNINKVDLNYNKLLRYIPKAEYDVKTQITLKMSGFTTNLAPSSVGINSENKLSIFVTKQLDDNYSLINTSYNKTKGKAVIRNVFNVPQLSYTEEYGQNLGTDFITKMAFDYQTDQNGQLEPNSQYIISGTNISQKNIKTMVIEQEFSLEITNLGETPVILDSRKYNQGETMTINVYSGLTLSTSNNIFTFDGEKLILRLPANYNFVKSTPFAIFPNTGGTYFDSYNQAIQNGTITYSATTYGFNMCNYKINVRNNSYNYLGSPELIISGLNQNSFYKTNLLKKTIIKRIKDAWGSYSNSDEIIIDAGNDLSPKNYYIATELNHTYTRPSEPISLSTGTTLSTIDSSYYYDGIAILPNRGLAGNADVTKSKIFISDEKVIDVNSITKINTGITSLGYNAILPTSPIILKTPLSSHTYFCPFVFGKLYVQSGYGTIQQTSGFANGTTNTYDSFITSNSIAGSSLYNNSCVIPWANANVILKNQAVIEIINTGEIESYFPNGIILQPGERLAISELPITPSNGTSGFYNLVRPLNPLLLNLSTNYGYNQVSKKFFSCSYRISFLNFQLYNSNGTFSNKTANFSIDFQDNVATINGVKPRFLLSEYGDQVWVNKNTWGNLNCSSYYSWINLVRLAQLNYSSMFVEGIIMTASNDSPIKKCSFVEFENLPPLSSQNQAWRFQQCSGNGLDFWVYR